MSMKTLEKAILQELRTLTRKPSLKMSEVMEWSTSESTVRKNLTAGENIYYLRVMGVWCAVREK